MVIFPREISDFLKGSGGLLNSEALDIQFGQSDVYDNSPATPHHNRAPGTRARDKNNARKRKGTGWKGQMGVNWDE